MSERLGEEQGQGALFGGPGWSGNERAKKWYIGVLKIILAWLVLVEPVPFLVKVLVVLLHFKYKK